MSKGNNTTTSKLADDVLKKGGASEEEIRRTGEITDIDAAAAKLYKNGLGVSPASPVHRLTWRDAVLSEFAAIEPEQDLAFEAVIRKSLEALRANKAAGMQFDANGKVTEKSIADLGAAGWWGVRVPKEYGGIDASTVHVMRGITALSAAGFQNEAGLQSVHGCIGVIGPLKIFGTPTLKERLRDLATGTRMSAFALTEPGAGSDLSAVKTTAKKVGDKYYITGEKVFITNSYYGRMICVVANVEGEKKKAVFVLDLPATDTESFKLVKYGLHPLKHCYNHGLIFNNFEVPVENRVTDAETNGMLAAYHGLNYGRIAVLANAAGGLRQIIRSITPKSWGEYRRTMGDSIQNRELVQVRIARAAALMVACDAIRDWSSSVLDQGYRGELECTIAKVFGSWAQQEGAIEIGLLTHGGRALREGNMIGDNLFDFLAALIYEGENHMLLMKYFLEFNTDHGSRFMLPTGNAIDAIKAGKVLTGVPSLLWNGLKFGAWSVGALARTVFSRQSTPEGMDKRLASHVQFALKQAKKLAIQSSYHMVKHQVKLQKRQSRIVDLSKLSMWTIVMLVTAMHAHRSGNKTTIAAADVMCQVLRQKINPQHPSDAFYADCAKTARMVIEGELAELEGTVESPIVHPYAQ